MSTTEEPAWGHYGKIVQWYRASLMRKLMKTWIIGSSLVGLGSILAGLSFWTTDIFAEVTRAIIIIVGIFCTVGGPLYTVLQMPKLLNEERYLALFHNGLLFRRNEDIQFIEWDELMEVQWDELSDSLQLVHRQSPPTPVDMTFVGIENKELAKQINRIRIKAQMGLRLSPSS